MGNALFYHLTRSSLDQLLPALIGKARTAGWRIELRGARPDRMAALDETLWQRDGFLPHGLAGGQHDARQPVLLTIAEAGRAAANAPHCVMALDGAEVGPEEPAALERVCIVFDGNDPAAVDRARVQWRSLTATGVPAEYWSEADGRWERKA